MNEQRLNELVEFYEKYLTDREKGRAEVYILEHLKYGTFDYVVNDKNEVIGLCRWNISDDGKTALICDLAIDKAWRGKGLGKHFLKRGLQLWKDVTKIEFQRGLRGDSRYRTIPIEHILKHNNF